MITEIARVKAGWSQNEYYWIRIDGNKAKMVRRYTEDGGETWRDVYKGRADAEYTCPIEGEVNTENARRALRKLFMDRLFLVSETEPFTKALNELNLEPA